MNTISCGLLGILTNESLSGYDLMLKMNMFWHVGHSRIYPVLNKLEQDGYVKFKLIEQSGKPDKKVYTPTEKGFEAVKVWLEEVTDAPDNKDEMMLKTYCINLLDAASAQKLFIARKDLYQKKVSDYEKKISDFKELYGTSLNHIDSPHFGRLIMFNKILGDARWGVRWCDWVSSLYAESKEINIFEGPKG